MPASAVGEPATTTTEAGPLATTLRIDEKGSTMSSSRPSAWRSASPSTPSRQRA
jgi:hypothetical protein